MLHQSHQHAMLHDHDEVDHNSSNYNNAYFYSISQRLILTFRTDGRPSPNLIVDDDISLLKTFPTHFSIVWTTLTIILISTTGFGFYQLLQENTFLLSIHPHVIVIMFFVTPAMFLLVLCIGNYFKYYACEKAKFEANRPVYVENFPQKPYFNNNFINDTFVRMLAFVGATFALGCGILFWLLFPNANKLSSKRILEGQQLLSGLMMLVTVTLYSFHRILRPSFVTDVLFTGAEIEAVNIAFDGLDSVSFFTIAFVGKDIIDIDWLFAATRYVMFLWFVTSSFRMIWLFIVHLSFD